MCAAEFEELEHTADVGLRVRGATFEALCENAARAAYGLIGEAAFAPSETSIRRIEVVYERLDDGLYEWLRAVLLAFAVDGFFAVRISATTDGSKLAGVLEGGAFDVSRHVFFTELKAVTRHGLVVRKTGDGFEAEVIFDV